MEPNLKNNKTRSTLQNTILEQKSRNKVKNNKVKPKKAWPVAMAWIAFFITLFYCISSLYNTNLITVDPGFTRAFYSSLILCFPLTLFMISIVCTYFNFPLKLKTVLCIAASMIIGIPISAILFFYLISPQYPTYISYLPIAPIILPIIFLVFSKLKNRRTIIDPNSYKISAMLKISTIIIVLMAISEFCLFIFLIAREL